MLNESKNQALNYIQNDEILYIPHFFYEWDSETKKMSRIERDIFLDLRTMYFGNATANNGKIDAKDKELLYYQLGCNTDEEKQSLERLLKAKFKKVGNTYRHAKWDKQIKNIKWAMKNSKHGNTMSNAFGNGGNEQGNDDGNDDGNAMSNAERQKKLKAERKKLLTDLQGIGIVLDKDVAMAKLRELYNKHFSNIESENDNTDSNSGNNNGNGGNEQGNDDGNESNAQKRANNQDNNQNQDKNKNNISLTQAGEIDFKNEQILMTNIQQWQAPTLDEMRSLLINNNIFGIFNQEIYDHCLKKFKTHYENEEAKGYRLVTQNIRIQKLIEWVKRERPNQTTTTDIENKPNNKKPCNKETVMLNGLRFEVFANMTAKQTYYFVKKHQLKTETSDEAYKRLTQEINWKNFDYPTFFEQFEQANRAIA